MNMEKRALLAVLLSLIIWIAYNYFVVKPKIEPPLPTAETTGQTAESASSAAPASPQAPIESTVGSPGSLIIPAAALAPAEELAAASEAVSAPAPEKQIVIETDLYRAAFSTKRAVLTSFELKKYRARHTQTDEADKSKPKTAEADSSNVEYSNLIPPEQVGTEQLPFMLKFQDQELQTQLYEKNFQTTAPSTLALSADRPKNSVIFTRTLPNGLTVEKQFEFDNDTYLININLTMSNSSSQKISAKNQILVGTSIAHEETTGRSMGFVGPQTMIDGKIQKTNVKKFTTPEKYVGHINWTAISDIYFFIALIPVFPGIDQVYQAEADPLPGEPKAGSQPYELGLWTAINELEPHTKSNQKLMCYLGPKEFERLEALGHELDKVIDFGTFAMLAKPLLKAMNLINAYTGNYGLAIIILTMAVRLVFTPLTHYQMKSMRKMQTLQPEVNRLKNKFKKDPQLANQEMMKLYKEHGVNPASGCLPMLIQIPVFFALYSVLSQAIELRGAPFIFWITDLSAKDPTKITPILMGVSMFFQQRLTPSTADPKQKQIFMFMPLIMTFLFINFPSGLVLYWLVSNLLSLSYQGVAKLYRTRQAKSAEK